MQLNKYFCFLAFLISMCYSSLAQEKIRLKKVGLSDGLSQSSAYKVLQDKEGFIWIATQDGLNKYDGYQFTVFRSSQNNNQNISNNFINDIVEDNNGDMWIATSHGLCKWNRETNDFTNFLPETHKDFKGQIIHKLLYTNDHKIWFAHDNGLSYIDISTNKITNCWSSKKLLADYELHRRIYLLKDNYNQVWLTLLDSGVVMIKDNIPLRIKKEYNKGLTSNFIRDAFIGINGEVWFPTIEGLVYFNSKTNQFEKILDNASKINLSNVRNAVFDDKKNLWILLAENGIVKYDFNNKKIIQHYSNANNNVRGLNGNDFSKCYTDNEGRLWLFNTERNSFSILNSSSNSFVSYGMGNDPYSVSGLLLSFFPGKNKEIWIGTDDGIVIYNPQLENFKHICHIPGNDSTLNQNNVRHIFKDKKGRTWVNTNPALNLKKNDNAGFIHYSNNDPRLGLINNRRISYIYEDNKERLWFGTYDGIFLFNEETKKFDEIKVVSTLKENSKSVRFIFQNKKGELLLIYNEVIIAKLHEESEQFIEEHYLPFLRNTDLQVAIELPDNKMFFGTWASFFIYDFKSKKVKYYPYHFGDKNSISNPEVNDACLKNDSILWIATANGLNRFNIYTEKFKYYFIEEGLPNQYIYHILPDSVGNLWMSTNNGISFFNTSTEIFKNYDVNDGLQSNEFNGNSAFTNGIEFFFGGINGYNYFVPSKIKKNENPPSLYFTDLKIDNKKIVPGDTTKILEKRLENTQTINVNEGVHSISIDFVGLDFTAPNSINYFYSLEKTGVNDSISWLQLINQRSINILNPEHGDYTLKIKAVNKDGVESQIKQLNIIILPPFYKTTWFRIILIISVLLIIYIIYRLRIKAIKHQKDELEKLVTKRTVEVVEQRDEAEKQKKIAIDQKEEIVVQKEIIEIKNKEILDSIHYAKRIQDAMLKSEEHVSKHLPSHFILFKPKDIVSGDFYWALEKSDYLYVAAVDCTGHGVPGAFMSMLGIAFLNEITSGDEILSAATVLDKLRDKIIENLSKGEHADQKDGMDISLYRLNISTNELEWAGANNPLWIVCNDKDSLQNISSKNKSAVIYTTTEIYQSTLLEIKPDKQSIGYTEQPKPFTNHQLTLTKNCSIYIFTDGFADQFGGEKGKKFKYASLKQLVLQTNHLSVQDQKNKMNEVFENWRGKLEQIDDVCFIGLKI